MEYQIIRATPETGQIEVLYKQNGADVAVFAIDVPIIGGVFISGEALDIEIQHRAPVWIEVRKQELAAARGFDEITRLVKSLDAPSNLVHAADVKANVDMWEQVTFEQKLCKALIKFKLLESDPTTIFLTKL